MTEIWKDVVGFEGLYEVSNFGRVKSLSRLVASRYGCQRRLPETILQPARDKSGYDKVGLHNSAEGKKMRATAVHALVCEAFHGAKPTPQHQVNHKNGFRTDNRASNLEWVTALENIRHSIDVLGSVKHGEACGLAKLTEGDVRRIRGLLNAGMTAKEVAQQFNIHRNNVYSIRSGTTWKHVA